MRKITALFLAFLMVLVIGCNTQQQVPTQQPAVPIVNNVQDNSADDAKAETPTQTEAPKQAETPKAEDSVTINVEAFQFGFSPNPIKVKKGQKVTLNIKSMDVTHGFALPDYGINEQISPDKTTTVTFKADKAGEFGFYCSVFCGSGHARMNGKLIVS